MFTKFRKKLERVDIYLVLSFIVGLIPTSFIIHIMAVDFSGFYFQAVSFLKYHSYSYQTLTNYCENPINTGLNARTPFVPLLLAGSLSVFNQTLLGIYFPFFLARICITPLTYLVGKFFLPSRVAFLAALLTIFIPKLQTYSYGAFEADVFVALFYLLALFFYFKSENMKKFRFVILTGLSLGIDALSKSTGFALGIGFLLAVFLEQGRGIFTSKIVQKRFAILLLYFLIIIGPFLTWTYVTHHQFYIATQNDRSLTYIIHNLPSLLTTVPLYLTGVDQTLGQKISLVTAFFILFFFVGLFISIYKKQLTLTVPTLFTMVLISTLSTCLIGGNAPYSLEFVSILGFMMPIVGILFFLGMYKFVIWGLHLIKRNNLRYLVLTVILLICMYKFINNFFTARYALNFIPTEYYVSLPTILKHREPFLFGDVEYAIENNLLMFKGPTIHREIRQQFTEYQFEPFSPFYRIILLSITLPALIVFALDRRKET